MALEKARIVPEDDSSSTVHVLFNPTEYSVQSNVGWTDDQNGAPNQYLPKVSGNLTMELFFDTSMEGTDVRIYINKLNGLLQEDTQKKRPRKYTFAWGTFQYEGYMEIKSQKFTLFMENGIPLRARVGVTFDQRDESTASTSSSTQATGQVVAGQGESLSEAANKQYNDPTQWRPIAEASNIDDPLQDMTNVMLNVPGKK
ncbi:CIS tube protein [Paenibacillus nuruki]|uniref:CIS tube protein n=1 Tax=Paenibacillus nuruki TaxID=1886670 RepID=UPI002803DA43|nr:hypothetical protein [Paenibacillus nuruki]CAJ1317745.1 hypothetical protein AASFL403_21255 [Paenibacillus nuruki]